MRSISGVETQNLFFDKFHTPCLYSRNIIVFEMQTIIMTNAAYHFISFKSLQKLEKQVLCS